MPERNTDGKVEGKQGSASQACERQKQTEIRGRRATPHPTKCWEKGIAVSNPKNEEQNKNISKQEEAISKWAQTLATQLERFLRTREGQLDFPHHLYERKSGE